MTARGLMLALGLALVFPDQAQAQARGGQSGGSTRTTGRAVGGFGGGGGLSGNRDYGDNTTVGTAIISSDPETRRIIVIADEDTNTEIGKVISNLDKPKPQVLIKVVFLEVTYNKGSDIGIEGGTKKPMFGANSGVSGTAVNTFGMSTLNSAGTGSVVNAFGQAVQNLAASPYGAGAGLYQILGQDFQATLRAVAQSGRAEVLSRPSVLARNNQPATITVGQSVPLITNVRYDTLGNAINGVSYQDVGIILRVTPFINSDDTVEMIVSPELSSVSPTDTVPVSLGVSAPVIDKRAADTVVVTPNKQTVIIGGLIQTKQSEYNSKIPVLGDIPLLGNAFKRKQKGNVKTELIIFMTPHILKDPQQLAAVTLDETGKSQMDKSFNQKDLDRFLDNLPIKSAENQSPAPATKPKSNPAPASRR